MRFKNAEEFQDALVNAALASTLSLDDKEHKPGDRGFMPSSEWMELKGIAVCKCERCLTIRAMRRAAMNIPGTANTPGLGDCLTPGCKNKSAPALKRGLCMRCHSKAKTLVTSGKTTWERLAEMGLATANDSDDPFLQAFNERNK